MNCPLRLLAMPALMIFGSLLPAGTAPQTIAKSTPAEAAKISDQAYAELQKKAYGAALPLYEKALALAPKRAELWNEYGICLRNLHRFPAAVRAGWRAIQLDGSRTSQPWTAQANTLMEVREWKAAQACLEKVESLHKDRPFVARAWLNLAFRKLATGEAQGVVDDCRRAIKLDPGNALAWIDLGQALACTGGDLKEATASFEKGQALATQQNDKQQAEYAGQLLTKTKAGESIRPSLVAGRSWQLIPEALLSLPRADASLVPLPALVEHRYNLDGGAVLAVSLPEAWTESLERERPEHLFMARFSIAGQEGFKVFFSPIKGVGNPLGVKASADDAAKRLLAGSVEPELVPRELTSSSAKGYWLLSTNQKSEGKEPAKGEYRHLVTILMDVSQLQCVALVLTNSKAPEVVDPCLSAFSTARKIEPATEH
jgi:tetratricopeptide (TPR) repeat protein